MNKINKKTKAAWSAILLAALAMLLSYSNQAQQARDSYVEFQETQEEIKNTSDLAAAAFKQSYILYYDVMKKDQPETDIYKLFISGMEDESTQTKQNLVYNFDEARRDFNNSYPFMDTMAKSTKTTTEISTSDSIKEEEKALKTYAWYLSFSFDNEGILHISHLPDDIDYATAQRLYSNMLKQMFSTSSLSVYSDSNGSSSIRFYYDDEETEVVFKPAANISFSFGINEKDLNSWLTTNNNDSSYINQYYYSSEFESMFWMIGMLMCIGLFYFYRKYESEEETVVGSSFFAMMPAELLGIITFFGLVFINSAGFIVRSTQEGQHFFLLYGSASSIIDKILLYGFENMFYLIIIFGFTAYLFTYIYDTSVRHEWKKRSIIVRYWDVLRHTLRNSIQYMKHLDMSHNDNKRLFMAILLNFFIISFCCILWGFGIFFLIIYSFILFYVAKRYLSDVRHDYHKLLNLTKHLASGDLEQEMKEDLGIFNPFKDDMKDIQTNIRTAIEEEVHSQKMKTELITNVSHDLKTPLTSIISYVDLLKDDTLSEKDREKYIDILDKSSQRLKGLIEDLFEVSKANSGNVSLDLMKVDIVSLMKQVQVECGERLKKRKLTVKNTFSDEKIVMDLDSQKTYRIFENLIGNVCKYAMKNTRVYVNIQDYSTFVEISIRNISEKELNFDPEDITERFTRGDASRNTEGSGLGLAIAKSFCELHDGSLKINIDGDLFKAVIRLPKKMEE